jgi:hypothetical protein
LPWHLLGKIDSPAAPFDVLEAKEAHTAETPVRSGVRAAGEPNGSCLEWGFFAPAVRFCFSRILVFPPNGLVIRFQSA